MLFQPLKSSHPIPVALLNSSQVLGMLPLACARPLPRNKFAAVVIRNYYENKQTTESTYWLYNIVFQAWIQKICFWITPVTPAILLSVFPPLPYSVLYGLVVRLSIALPAPRRNSFVSGVEGLQFAELSSAQNNCWWEKMSYSKQCTLCNSKFLVVKMMVFKSLWSYYIFFWLFA